MEPVSLRSTVRNCTLHHIVILTRSLVPRLSSRLRSRNDKPGDEARQLVHHLILRPQVRKKNQAVIYGKEGQWHPLSWWAGLHCLSPVTGYYAAGRQELLNTIGEIMEIHSTFKVHISH